MRSHLIPLFALASLAPLVLAGGILTAAEARAQQAPTQMTNGLEAAEARNRELVEAAFQKWGSGVGGPYDLLADDVSWTIVGGSDASRVYPSKDAFMSQVIRPFNARMSQGLKPTVRQLTTDGDKVIIFFDAAGLAKDGQPYANTYAWFWEMRDGRVVRAYAFYDAIAFNALWRRIAP